MLPFLNVLHNLLFNTGILLVCYKTIFILIFFIRLEDGNSLESRVLRTQKNDAMDHKIWI